MRWFALLIFITGFFNSWAQEKNPGLITGSVLDEKSSPLQSATVQLLSFKDSTNPRTVLTSINGEFEISNIPFGYYKLKVTYTGLQTVILDSLFFRLERYDFNLNEIILKQKTLSSLDAIIVYAEKPLVQSKDGNITFNAGESALSAGSNASDLLANVPLISKDPSGKIMVRGKSPKILIDDKPVELNLEQLQDLLESMPGSSIEKIEVLTNPPPQYAGEEGGVINIVTRKGTVGMNGRISFYAGTRGEEGGNLSLHYRKQGLTFSIHAGAGYNTYIGNGYYNRINTNNSALQSVNQYRNDNQRPNGRATVNYDLNKFHNLNLVLQYNQNHFDNNSTLEYITSNAAAEVTRLFDRTINSKGNNYSPGITISYTLRTNRAGETLQLISNFNRSGNESNREFYEKYFNPDHSATGKDSTQIQLTDNLYKGKNFRLSYDLPLDNKKTFISLGGFYNSSSSDMNADASFFNINSSGWDALEALTNHFLFFQDITNARAAIKQLLGQSFNLSGGLAAEQTRIRFNLFKTNSTEKNGYWN
ncbi:MAG TPA: TonB-dependent receptor, partial [Flavisolibacter sp.]|nr:TonB-dependent receptor [Flavisolibacter sp.]